MEALKTKVDSWIGMTSVIVPVTPGRVKLNYLSPTGICLIAIDLYQSGGVWQIGGLAAGLNWDSLMDMNEDS